MTVRHQKTVTTLLEAAPYIRGFWGKAIVVAFGGIVIRSPRLGDQLAADIALLRMVGMQPVAVHADGEGVADAIRAPGAAAIQIIPEVEQLRLSPGDSAGQAPVATARVAVSLLQRIRQVTVGEGVPVITVPSAGTESMSPADLVAGELAAGLLAEKLVLVGDQGGLTQNLPAEEMPLSECDLAYLGALVAAGGVPHDLLPKVAAARTALEAGVASAHIIDGRVEHALLLEVLTDAGCGTKVTP